MASHDSCANKTVNNTTNQCNVEIKLKYEFPIPPMTQLLPNGAWAKRERFLSLVV